MKIAFITNLRTPYRTLQLNEYAKIKDTKITAYYTHKQNENRKWETNKSLGFNEVDLKGIKISNNYGYFNFGVMSVVKNNDLIILGGYEQATMIIMSLICRILKKPYILFLDGISTNRLKAKENKIKKYFKNIVIKNAEASMANGTIGKRYLSEVFNYPTEKIYNQYLTVDKNRIDEIYKNKNIHRTEIRERLGIPKKHKVIIYSGRLIEIKNIDLVLSAIHKLDNNKEITFLITGGGELEKHIKEKADELGINTVITGFIKNQEELFKHYSAGDIFILPSKVEPWGLVVNEAMIMGLPILVSNICGCSLDLIVENENGMKFSPYDVEYTAELIKKVISSDMYKMGMKSREIISKWTFENSRLNLEKIINQLK